VQAAPLIERAFYRCQALGLKIFTQNRRGERNFGEVEHFIRGVIYQLMMCLLFIMFVFHLILL
jgi:hypothetical protein